ncbi:peptide/nickel transport system permease protein [Desulfonauticus submarinus]|uniref:Peptide/nickel transport system permease protein n=1 Tax=Desulfonauticus submarinus TaxID=206665 RepID=A0A1H0BDE0_9BACT|nr:ABC transporter permease [Desulfonauticus submarinus]SDN43611.1 peptide/nickel transport system permease protein [Desulfonauticus submarinus]
MFRENKKIFIGIMILLAMFTIFIVGPLFSPYTYESQNIYNRLKPPSLKHPFGTDQFGRDIFTRIMYGGRISFSIAFMTMLGSFLLGTIVGIISGYFGGFVEEILMMISDIILSLPSLIVILALVSFLGTSLLNIIYILAIMSWPKYARLVRASVIEIKNEDFVFLTNLMGAKPFYIISRHILPHAIIPTLTLASFDFGRKVVSIAGLGFLGVGIQPPTPEWGMMIREGFSYIFTAPHLILAPGGMTVITLISSNLLGEGIQESLNRNLNLAEI